MLYEIDPQLMAAFSVNWEASDEQLMVCIRGGDENALATLHRRHSGILRSVVKRVVTADADVDEVLQEALIETWNRCHLFDEKKGKVLGWLITMVRRRAIDRVRRRLSYDRAADRLRLAGEAHPQETHTHVEEDVMKSEQAKILRQLLDSLPPAQKEAVQLAFYSGLSQREIAAHTGIPLGTIKTRLELALRKLRASILALGIEKWDFALC